MTDFILLGIDGGASKVLVNRVMVHTDPIRFSTVKPCVEVNYDTSNHYKSGFKPVPLKKQLSQREKGAVEQTGTEKKQEKAIIDTFQRAIQAVLPNDDQESQVIIGIGLPGLKIKNKRGIDAMANGPRMPRFLANLEKALKDTGLTGLEPIHQLGSDADYCGLGERFGERGALRDVANAYYVGVGTGVADALLIDNELVPFDHIKSWMAKSWEIVRQDGVTYESIISAKGIQQRYAELTDQSLEYLMEQKIFPWQIYERALDGEEAAVELVKTVADAFTELFFNRIKALAVGDDSVKLIQPDRVLSSDHIYEGNILDRIVVGQRLGDIWQFSDFAPLFKDVVYTRLSSMIHQSDLPNEIKNAYLTQTKRLDDEFIVGSEIRHAPALGAAVDAYFHWSQ
ncbi:MAG: hypothetical protein K9N34_00445 [Candidatus Marinimicrobia bacterium]|nr:hypothetical protein [Candidatus Neomarinimicrobiota bacterium]MCF7840001.1 hypothetical protein [Candidatus Neomarinimicrobiota bacterium]